LNLWNIKDIFNHFSTIPKIEMEMKINTCIIPKIEMEMEINSCTIPKIKMEMDINSCTNSVDPLNTTCWENL